MGRYGPPEFTDYPDNGCDLAPRCLECPLPACRYEMLPKQGAAWVLAERIQRLIDQGLTADQVAADLGISRRTVFRVRRQRREMALPVIQEG